jgi:glucose-1-phosphate thymidylyltransferase
VKLIILAAGYATRLYPLTLNKAKPLLPVAGKPMIDHVVESLAPIAELDGVIVVTNAKFAGQFADWALSQKDRHPRLRFTVVNDQSTDDTNKLGAIGDLQLVLTRENIQDDVIVVAGDNLFSEKLGAFGAYCREVGTPVLGVYDVGSLELIKKYCAINTDTAGRISFFEEKPQNLTSTLTGIALYYYPQSVLPLIGQYIKEGNNPDQPGRLVQWLYPRLPFHTWRVPGTWYDIGSKEALEEADRVFTQG